MANLLQISFEVIGIYRPGLEIYIALLVVHRVAFRCLLLTYPLKVKFDGHSVGPHTAAARKYNLRLMPSAWCISYPGRCHFVTLRRFPLSPERPTDEVFLVLMNSFFTGPKAPKVPRYLRFCW
jgi:hypothetical protein